MELKNSEVKHEVYSSGSSVTKLSTEELAANQSICEEWSLSIDLKLHNRSSTQWTSIFSLNAYNNTRHQDQRILAVSIRQDQLSVMLMVSYDMHTNQSYTYTATKRVNIGNWINLKISQISGLYEVKLDHKLVYNKTNFAPTTWTNVNLITGSTNAKKNVLITTHYRNFKINTCETKSKKF